MINKWTKEQTIIALSVYCKIPFNKATNTNTEIVKAANLIGRSPIAVKMKVGNFGSFDPELKAKGIVGLSNTSKLDEEVWYEYCNDWGKLAYDSALIIAKLENKSLEELIGLDIKNILRVKNEKDWLSKELIKIFFAIQF